MNKADTNHLCPWGNKQAQCEVCARIANTETNAAGKGGRTRSEDLELSVVRVMLEHRTAEVRAPCRYQRYSQCKGPEVERGPVLELNESGESCRERGQGHLRYYNQIVGGQSQNQGEDHYKMLGRQRW